MNAPENTSAMGLHVIITGNPIHGFEVYGPFATGADAAEFGNTDPHMEADWWVMPLYAIEDGEARP